MRIATILAVVLAGTASCNREDDFDTRFEAAKQDIETQAGEIDAEMTRRAKQASSPADGEPGTEPQAQ